MGSSLPSGLNLLCRGLVLAFCAQAGCCAAIAPRITTTRGDHKIPPKAMPQHTMPPHTVLLSTMMSDLSAQPGFTDRMMAALAKQSKTGAAILSPALLEAMRKVILGKDWQGLDHFPGWKMADINPVAEVADAVAGEADKQADQAGRPITDYVDLGEYSLDREETVDLNKPSTLSGFSPEGLVAPIGDGVVRGDGPNPEIAPMHRESLRLAEVLNRLALNGDAGNRLEGVVPMTALLGGSAARTPEDLLRALLAGGHQVTVADARYFANFGHLHYEGMDVMMPFWVNAQVWIPGKREQLHVPVAHAEYEWFIRGPKIDADVSFYFGIDGKAEFRTMDTLDQAWVMGRHAHEYRGADAVEVTRLSGLLVLAYAHEHLAHPQLAFGGYYALGVCQDGIAAIERKMTGRSTLFPNTSDMALFKDPRDAEIDALLAAIPKDRSGKPPELERIFGSLPTTDLAAITIPGLASDLESVQAAWRDGTLGRRPRPLWSTLLLWVCGLAGTLLLVWFGFRRRYGSRVDTG